MRNTAHNFSLHVGWPSKRSVPQRFAVLNYAVNAVDIVAGDSAGVMLGQKAAIQT
ncbi:MAG: hypothetical protein NTY19_02020 [Planctomycetota bacterium]|nr:hypothetical protein [Planctomycetota bacterium]